MPQAAITRSPSQLSSDGMTSPKTPTFSLCAGIGWPASALKTKGISEMWVTSCFITTSQKRLDENFGWSTIVPPAPSVDQVDQLWAFTWKKGR